MRRATTLMSVLVLVVAAGVAVSQTAEDNGGPYAGPVAQAPLPIDGNWHQFIFGDVGEGTGPIEFNGGGVLDIADCCLSGDQFAVYDFDVYLGDTSVPTTVGDSGGDPDANCSDPRWSAASVTLGPGDHSIEIVPIASPFGSGGVDLRFPGQGCGPPLIAVPTMSQNTLIALALLLAVAGFFVLRRRFAH